MTAKGLHIVQRRYKHAQKKYNSENVIQDTDNVLVHKRVFKFISLCKDKWILVSKSESVSDSRVTRVR